MAALLVVAEVGLVGWLPLWNLLGVIVLLYCWRRRVGRSVDGDFWMRSVRIFGNIWDVILTSGVAYMCCDGLRMVKWSMWTLRVRVVVGHIGVLRSKIISEAFS